MVDIFTCKRINPRFEVTLPVIITSPAGLVVNAQTINLSLGGMALQCTTDERNQITPQGDFLWAGRPVEIMIDMRLPSCQQALRMRCAIVYSRRLAQEKCQLGLRVVELPEDMQQCITAFLESMSG